MQSEIPFTCWEPLPVVEVVQLFEHAPFQWGLAGGYAIEQCLGKSIREHGDIDVVVFRDEQLQLQRWLKDWQLFAADPPTHLRPWKEEEVLPVGVHDIWGHRQREQAWQLQVMLCEADGEEWFSRRNPRIRGRREAMIVEYRGIPCLSVEIQLLYKARNFRPKDELDFRECLPLLSAEARQWLIANLRLQDSERHPWLECLLE
jgi:hypothetical protein